MTYTTETMPASPCGFRLLEDHRLHYRPSTARRTDCSDPAPAMVERWLTPFRVVRAFVLRHGVREFLGVLDP